MAQMTSSRRLICVPECRGGVRRTEHTYLFTAECNVNAGTQCLQGIEKDSVLRVVLLKNANLYLRSRSDDGLGQSWEHWFSLFPDAKSFFLVPIVSGNGLLGVIYTDYSRSNVQGWTSEELELVEAIKQVICAALQAERT